MIHVSFAVLLCICWCTAGERWLRDMDLAHWVCELWLNPWVYCFRHALTTSPQWPGSRLHSSRGGPLLTHSHPLLPSLFPQHPPSPLFLTLPLLSTSLNLSLHAVFFHNPSCFPFSLYFYHTVVNKTETVCWHLGETGPANGDKVSLNTRHSNILIRTVEWAPFVDNKMFLYTEVAVFRTTRLTQMLSWEFEEIKQNVCLTWVFPFTTALHGTYTFIFQWELLNLIHSLYYIT